MAFLVGQAIGLEVTDTAGDYIHLYRGDSAALGECLGRIQRTAAAVLSAICIDDTAAGRDAARSAA